jgi:all-trans-retinol dehydrogenase (NAD+)
MSVALRRASNLLTGIIGHITLNPFVTAALLWVLTKAPIRVRNRLLSNITILQDPQRYAQLVKALKWCLALGVTRVANRQLNEVALNGGKWGNDKKQWNWGEEVAVVTGGCSGIGELVVKRLIGRGIRVAVLDVKALPGGLEGCKFLAHFCSWCCEAGGLMCGRCSCQVL